MNLYRVWCRFEPDHVAQITGRKGQWRVFKSFSIHVQCARDVTLLPNSRQLAIVSTKPYPKGSIIRPHRELKRVLAFRKANVGN
jgi:hypothetical protein